MCRGSFWAQIPPDFILCDFYVEYDCKGYSVLLYKCKKSIRKKSQTCKKILYAKENSF